jgi:hypothetical protein
VGALTVASLGTYVFYWLYTTWRELRDELGDQSMAPVWHALTLALPPYGLFRFHAHMRTIKEAAESRRVVTSLRPGLCVLGLLGMTVLTRVSGRAVHPLDLLGFGIEASVLMWAQSALNSTWAERLPQILAKSAPHWLEWIVLAMGAFLWLSSLVVWSCETQGWMCDLLG